MKKTVLLLLLVLVFFIGFLSSRLLQLVKLGQLEQLGQFSKITPTPKPRPLDKYSLENLSKTEVTPGKITIEKVLKEDKNFTSYLFSMSFDPTLQGKTPKKVTGLLNIPILPSPAEVPSVSRGTKSGLIILIRGYVDQSTYQTGLGTSRVGEFYAQNGFITVAPDFLGYGESDSEAGNIFESRFQTYTTVLTLLKTLESLKSNPNLISSSTELFGSTSNLITQSLNNLSSLSLWAHSNGGQIALTILEITGKPYPTVLWAPVSKPFPYSVLYYTDESDDGGKLIRGELAKFEEDYDTDQYSLDKYLDRIAKDIPIRINQGTADDAVPVTWTDLLVKNLKSTGIASEYIKYPGANHNLTPGWNEAVAKDLEFFRQNTNQKTLRF